MKKVIVGVGIPGSGKTTVLKNLAARNGYEYICPDDIRLRMTGNAADQSKNKEVWAEAYSEVDLLLKEGKTIVFDASFTNKNDRRRFIDFARQCGAEKVQAVFADIPLEIAKERNANRERKVPEYAIERMRGEVWDVPPSVEEGFDSVFTIDEFQKLVEADMEWEGEVLHKEFKPR